MSDQDQSLGEFLRNEREKLGITIEQVASASKISVRLLHALEGDQYSDLPAKPFVRGFVTSYSRFIGLNPKEVLSQFDFFISQKVGERPSREAGHSGYIFEKRDGDQSRLILWIVMGSFLLIGSISLLVLKPSLKHQKQKHLDKLKVLAKPSETPSTLPEPRFSAIPTTEPSPIVKDLTKTTMASPLPVTPEPTTSSSPAPSVEPSPKPDPLNSGVNLAPESIKHRLMLKAWADVWVRYQCDDRTMMKFILRAGRLLALRGADRILLEVSNPKSITFNYNRGSSKPMKFSRLILPASAEVTEPLFKNEAPLPATDDPAPQPEAVSSPNP